jgi:ATP-dependent Clp protease ATP-binding subunit ClpA
MEPQAIDLVDEAASALQVARGSKPEAIDAAERALMRLRIEEEALSKEKDKASRARLEEVRREVAEAQASSTASLSCQSEQESHRNQLTNHSLITDHCQNSRRACAPCCSNLRASVGAPRSSRP